MYVFVLLLYVVFVSCFVFLVVCVYCYLFCLCVVLCSSGQGRTAVADCLEVKFINQIKSFSHVTGLTTTPLYRKVTNDADVSGNRVKGVAK